MNKDICKIYKDAKLPPCAELLLNSNPIIKDNKLIYKNLNRLFFFISVNNSVKLPDTFDVNLQISLYHYIVGLFLHSFLNDKNKYEENTKIVKDEKTNELIHKIIKDPPKDLSDNYQYSLIFIYANNNAILNPFTYTITIKPLIFYILLVLNRIENHPGLFFVNNDYVLEDTINFILATLHIELPPNILYN